MTSVSPGRERVSPALDPPSLVGAAVGAYLVESRLGSGGMGEVYLVRHRRSRETAALKVVRKSVADAPSVKRRFVQEAVVAAAVGSHRVARPLDVGHLPDGRLYMLLEHVPGKTLAQVLEERGPLPVATALRIVHRVADTLAIAHDRGIVHRDLKPSNLMVMADGDDPSIKLLDFGIARAPADLRLAHTVEHAIIGSPGYMSPEAALGRPVGGPADVFSLGVIAHEMLTGRLPFAPGALEELMAAPPPGLASCRPAGLDAVAAPLEALVAAMLAKAPAERPSMVEVRDRVAELGGRPALETVAPPAGPSGRDSMLLASTIESGMVSAERLPELERRLAAIVDERLAAPRRRRARVWLAAATGLVAGGALVAAWSARTEPVGPAREATLRRLTYEPADNQIMQIDLSPSGEMLAFVDLGGLALREIASGKTTRLSIPADEVAWLPDSERLVVSVTAGTIGEAPGGIYVVSRDGEERTRIADHAMDLAISHSGSRIAFSRDGELWVMDASGRGARRVQRPPAGKQLHTPAWSPDDRRLAYAVVAGGELTLATVDAAGGEPRAVTAKPLSPIRSTALAWLADGRLVYPRYRAEGSELWAVELDGDGNPRGSPRLIEEFLARALVDLSPSSDGRRLACLLSQARPDVYVADLDPSAAALSPLRRVTHNEASDLPIGFADDGRTLLVSELRDRKSMLVRQPLDGGERSETRLLGSASTIVPRPGGSGVLFWDRARRTPDDGEAPVSWRLMSIADDGGRAEEVTRLELPASTRPQLACAPSGACVLAEIALDSAEATFYRFDPARGRGQAIARAPFERDGNGISVALSPSGRRVALAAGDAVLTVDVEGGTLGRIAHDDVRAQFVAYGPDDTLYCAGFSKGVGDPYVLYRVAADGTAERLRSSAYEWMAWPTLSADGRRIALTMQSMEANVWLIEDP